EYDRRGIPTEALRKLAAERRLLIDRGERSFYGLPAVTLASADEAAHALADGRGVYAVDVTSSKTRDRSLKAFTRMEDGSAAGARAVVWTEQKLRYTLTPVNDPDRVPTGTGLPKDILGVYRDDNRYTETIWQQRDQKFGRMVYDPAAKTPWTHHGSTKSRVDSYEPIDETSDLLPELRAKQPTMLGNIFAVVAVLALPQLGAAAAMAVAPWLAPVYAGLVIFAKKFGDFIGDNQ
ncbi:MAG: hypothetical protein AAFX94_25740, partial [Myxococcota bacterium]